MGLCLGWDRMGKSEDGRGGDEDEEKRQMILLCELT